MRNISTILELEAILLESNPYHILLDVRTIQEFNEGHIESAVNLNVADPNFVAEIEKLDKLKTYIVYCKSGQRSAMASMIMNQKSLNVINCTFGFIHISGSNINTTR